MRYKALASVLIAGTAFFAAPAADAAVLDSQADDSAQSIPPSRTDPSYIYGNGFYLAVGYVPPRSLNFSGLRFRVNHSSSGNYLCPAGDIYEYYGTSTPETYNSGHLAGSIVTATTTPDQNGNCDYTPLDIYGRPAAILLTPNKYYVFLMAVGGNITNWVSMNGKPLAADTAQNFFGFRPATNATYRWGTTGLESAYFQLFDTAPPPVSQPDPCVITNSCASNVLFLPGIEGSRLYRPDYQGGTDQLWEPNIDSDVKDLYLSEDGTSARPDVYTKERDVIDELPSGANIYKSFIEKMNGLKTSGTISDWEPIAYDWRLSLNDILSYGNDVQGRIHYSGDLRATSTPYIIQELKRLAASSKTKKVSVVAHSNGGLLAKRLTEMLGPTQSSRLIDKIIFIAVPQSGTPAAISAGLHGDGQDHLFGLITSKATARTFARDAPMEYQLLPSAQYFTQIDNPVITFDPSLTDWIFRYGTIIHSQDRLHQFLADTFGRVDPQTGDIDQPIQFVDSLLSNAEALHSTLDTWAPPSGVQLLQIAGWGVPKTVEGITYKKKGTGVTPAPNFTIDGDGTVVVPSALWTSTSAAVMNYWLDLKKYSNDHWLGTFGGFHPFNHANILETETALDFIADKIASTTKPLADYGYLSSAAPSAVGSRLRYALHSPLTLNLYDDLGRHTGVSTTTGAIEEQIPGTYYTEFGDVKYIFSDAPVSTHVVMNGYDTGTFTFNVDQYDGEALTASTTFKDIPTTATSIVALDVSSDIASLSPMHIDADGDGIIDRNIEPRLNDIALYKEPLTITADSQTVIAGAALPVFKATLSGFSGSDTASSSNISGAPDCTVSILDTKTIGTYPIICTAGTLRSDKYSFDRFMPGMLTIRYDWNGFSAPIAHAVRQAQGPALFKAGSTIPVKFQLKDANGNPMQAATAPVWSLEGSTIRAEYKWDSAAEQYVYTWSTKGLIAGRFYTVYATLDDGQKYSVTVGLK